MTAPVHSTTSSAPSFTWTPLFSFASVSPGDHRLRRYRGEVPAHVDVVDLDLHELTLPLRVEQSSTFHLDLRNVLQEPRVGAEHLRTVFDVIHARRQHHFEVHLSAPIALMRFGHDLAWGEHISIRTMVSHSENIGWIEDLRSIRAHRRIVELSPVDGMLPDVDVRGLTLVDITNRSFEEGSTPTPIQTHWVRRMYRACAVARPRVPLRVGIDGMFHAPKDGLRLLQTMVLSDQATTQSMAG